MYSGHKVENMDANAVIQIVSRYNQLPQILLKMGRWPCGHWHVPQLPRRRSFHLQRLSLCYYFWLYHVLTKFRQQLWNIYIFDLSLIIDGSSFTLMQFASAPIHLHFWTRLISNHFRWYGSIWTCLSCPKVRINSYQFIYTIIKPSSQPLSNNGQRMDQDSASVIVQLLPKWEEQASSLWS